MKDLDIFKWLPEHTLNKITEEAGFMIFQDKDLVIKDKAKNDDCVYIITSWEVEVSIWNKVVSTLKEGDIFWELAFLTWKERTWTVRAK
jgi:CRP-like cAMP-binding protein